MAAVSCLSHDSFDCFKYSYEEKNQATQRYIKWVSSGLTCKFWIMNLPAYCFYIWSNGQWLLFNNF